MKKFFKVSTILMVLLSYSCSNNEDQIENPVSLELNVQKDLTELNQSMDKQFNGVVSNRQINIGREEGELSLNDITFEQIAEILPPSINGVLLRASHVDFHDNLVFVSYMKEGPEYLGGIDIIDISNEKDPKIISRITSDQADFTSIKFNDSKLLFTLAADVESNPYLTAYANLGEVYVNSDGSIDNLRITPLSGYAAVDVAPLNASSIIALSGSNGSVTKIGTDLFNIQLENPIEDLRSIAIANEKIAVLSGNKGLLLLNPQTLEVQQAIQTHELTPESKRTISFFGEQILVSEGSNGVGIYNWNVPNRTLSLPIQVLSDEVYDSNDIVTNAVTTTDNFVFMANGGAGLGISKINTLDNTVLEAGVLDTDGSVNYVKGTNKYIFLASGKGGLKIIKIQTSSGSEEFANCNEYPLYRGHANLNVNSNEVLNYRGATTLKNLNVGGELTYCGSLNIAHSVNINSNGIFNMYGSLAVGRYGKNYDLNINSGSVLKIHGNLTIYGNLNLNSGSKLEFVGSDSTIHVYGRVKRNSGSQVVGDYQDTSNKL